MVAAEWVAANTRTGMLTRRILRKPFQVGREAIGSLSDGSGLRARGGDRGRETLRGWRLGAETGGDGSGLGQGARQRAGDGHIPDLRPRPPPPPPAPTPAPSPELWGGTDRPVPALVDR